MTDIPHLGEILALLAPIAWSFAVILFRKTGEIVPALALNLFKNSLALMLFWITLVAVGQDLFRDVPASKYWLLIASGVIGIGISDTFFFMTLNRVGAGLQAIINTTYSPSIIFLSLIFLGEHLSAQQLLGVSAILGAVVVISRMPGPKSQISRRKLAVGVLFGVITTFTQAVSIVMIKPLLEESPLLWANTWRLLGGLVTSILLLGFFRGQRAGLTKLKQVRIWPTMIPGSFIGTYVSLLFWLGGMKYTQASVAASLNQTATLWTFLLAVLLLHEPVTKGRILGLAAGFSGVLLVTLG